jgi:hypothetical protein
MLLKWSGLRQKAKGFAFDMVEGVLQGCFQLRLQALGCGQKRQDRAFGHILRPNQGITGGTVVRISLTLVFVFGLLTITLHSKAMEESSKICLSDALRSIDYLYHFLDKGGEELDFSSITDLIIFALGDSRQFSGKELGSRYRSTGVYYRFMINAPADKVVTYIYHPEIPRSLVMPSSIRLRVKTSKFSPSVYKAWQEFDFSEQKILVLRGEEFEENTPDLTTGGYYGYTNELMVIIGVHEGNKFLLSVSRQIGISTVGRKGVVIGEDQDWNYFYSDMEGLTLKGLGFINSNIYESYTVSIFHQIENSDQILTRQDMFIWKRAGWCGINMVKAHHIVSGCQRYSQGIKFVLESPLLPSAEELVSMTRSVKGLSEEELRHTLALYDRRLQQLSTHDPVLSRREFQAIINNRKFLYSMDKEQMVALLLKEQLKIRLEKPSLMRPEVKNE